MKKHDIKTSVQCLLEFITADDTALLLFKDATNDGGCLSFLTCILLALKNSSSYCDDKLVKQDWLCKITNACAAKRHTIPQCLVKASKIQLKKANSHKLMKRRLGQSLGFTAHAHKTNTARFASATKTTVKIYSDENAYPPPNHWVYETDVIQNQWEEHLMLGD
ncbi:uncharacterized protein LACBIDRAFT_332592 [Laccaria bicolor S238N-H82]|uniref:Predicted protein n=1 Tax=Laccaria bicolor (strain S238N-H82 / ATCC MYA-4686) TaxID=486041 RepID=B0DTA1_LACBS|nr:uncharacterized protein LACBIDRAFT_332592 [Laccaria bicolor S238N-H82]EDR02183.1 predicted protein [Laccaria bicolor S238N-H82]|eukprot:XP_001887128.1 predicted protein [Laccaria bicolor S238N-H82]